MSWLPSIVTVAPTGEPATLDDAKAQCRVDDTASDGLLTNYIETARHLVEQNTGTKLMDQTVELRCSRWSDLYDLPVAPIASVTSITYLDLDGISQTLATSVYEAVLTGLSPLIRLQVNQLWPNTLDVSDAITVTVQAGYTDVPPTIRHAMLLLISQWYDERTSVPGIRQTPTADGSIPTLPNTFDALLANYRRF